MNITLLLQRKSEEEVSELVHCQYYVRLAPVGAIYRIIDKNSCEVFQYDCLMFIL